MKAGSNSLQRLRHLFQVRDVNPPSSNGESNRGIMTHTVFDCGMSWGRIK